MQFLDYEYWRFLGFIDWPVTIRRRLGLSEGRLPEGLVNWNTVCKWGSAYPDSMGSLQELFRAFPCSRRREARISPYENLVVLLFSRIGRQAVAYGFAILRLRALINSLFSFPALSLFSLFLSL